MEFDAESPPKRQLLPLQVDASDIERWLLARDPQAIGAWNELGPQEYARAFTAARTAGADVVDDLYFGIVDTISRRGTEDDFARLVTPILKRKGWLEGDEGQIANRVRLIYDTNLRLARASGRWSRYQATKAAFPYLRAFTVGDERVRHPPESKLSDHRAWDGIILPVDHPFWTRWWPPLGFRCRCAVVQMTRSQLARYRSGVTSEEELAEREARLGTPIFLSPVAPMRQQLGGMGERPGDPRLPGRPIVNVDDAEERGRREFEQQRQDSIRRAMDEQLARIGLVPPAPPPPPPAPRGFVSTIDPTVTAATIKVEPRLTVQKRMRPSVQAAANDPRYSKAKEFRDRSEAQFGAVSFSADFEDSTVSMIAALKPELDALSRQLGIPEIRGYKSLSVNSGAGANQGDGVMGINPRTFNGYAAEVGGAGAAGTLAKIAAQRETIKVEYQALQAQIAANDARMTAIEVATLEIRRLSDKPGWLEIFEEQQRLLIEAAKVRKKDGALWAKGRQLERVTSGGPPKPVTTWRPGDDPKARPFSSGSYSADGVDQARTTLFHEFAHHIHQYLKREGPRRQFGVPPLERDLINYYREAMGARRDRQPTSYGMTNEKEWFAENFALYAMGKKDLVDPTARELIERIFRGEY